MTTTTLTVVCLRPPACGDHLTPPGASTILSWPPGTAVAFPSASDAVRWAVDLLAAVGPSASRPAIGIDAGELDPAQAARAGALRGAAERCEAARPGEALVSEVVRLLVPDPRVADLRPVEGAAGTYALVPKPPPASTYDDALTRLGLPRQLAFEPPVGFVERPEAWAGLQTAWAATLDGERRAVFIGGEAGPGKTRLLAEFGAWASTRGGVVLYGGSTERVELPFQPFVEAIGALVDCLAPAVLDGLLPPSARHDLALLLPSARLSAAPRASVLATVDAVGAEGERHWAFEAMVDLLAGIAHRAPVLLLLDDVQWAERPTVRLIEHLLRSGRLEGVCIVVAHRAAPGEHTAAFADAASDLLRRPGVTRVTLGAFDDDAVRAFIAAATGASVVPPALEPVARLLAERTDGNPFLLTESWLQLREEGHLRRTAHGWSLGRLDALHTPRSVREATAHRVAGLSAACRSLLELSACLGVRFDAVTLAAAAHRDVAETLDVLAEAEAGGVVVEEGGGHFAFTHALIRQAIEEQLAAGTRRRLHLAIGTALAAGRSDDDARLAHHFAAAVPLVPSSVAVGHARAGARRSLQTVSFDDAVSVLDTALAVCTSDEERGDVLTDLAAAHARGGRSSDALAACTRAVELARRHGDAGRLVRAAKAIAEATWLGALDGTPAVALLGEALEVESDPRGRSELLSGLAAALAFAGRDDDSARAADTAAALATELGDDALLCDAIHAGLYAAVTPEALDRQLHSVRRGIAIACGRGDQYGELRLRCKAILRLLVACHPEDLRVQLDRHDELAARLRLPYFLRIVAGNDVAVALAEGRFSAAEAAVERYQGWLEVCGLPERGYGIQMFSIRREQGRLAELRPVLELGARFRRGERSWMPGLAVVYAEVGMIEEASALLDELSADGLASLPRDTLLPGVLSYLADACHATRHRVTAEAVAPLLAPYSGLMVYVPGLACYGAADRYLGKAYEVMDRSEEARRHYEAALALDERAGWSCWVAHSSFALGSILAERRRVADRERGIALLSSARDVAASLGMGSVVQRCSAVLGRALAPDAPRRLSELTPREHQVLILVAEGRSNREIGERLHASQHTIANHVRAILAKTGAANRTEAAAWAARRAAAESSRPLG